MRTALLLSGQPRNVELGYQYIKPHVLDTCNPDVFAFYWYEPQLFNEPVRNAGGHVASEPIPKDIGDTIEELYHPVTLLPEPQQIFDEKDYNTRKYPGIRPYFSLSQRWAIHTANMLKRRWEDAEDFTYDAVIRMRFDWAVRTPIHIENFDLTAISVPNDCSHPGGINDQFAIGNSANMNTYAYLYYRIDEYWRRDGIPFCDEILLGHHLRKSGICVKPEPISYGLIRSSTRTEWGRV